MSRSGEGLVAALRTRRGDFALEVDLSVAAGETLVLVGPNGAGKSTVIDVLAGRRPVGEGGSLRLGDRVLDDPATGTFTPTERRRVGVVFQDHLLFAHLSAHDNVAFGLRATGTDRRTAASRAGRWLDALDVASLAELRPGALSGGQAQRVAIARTLAVEPDLLLLDEPLAALDAGTRVEVRRLLRRHLDAFEGPAVVITHDPDDALLLADRIAVIERGRITQIGRPDEIRRRPATRYVATLTGTNLIAGSAAGGVVTVMRTGDGSGDGSAVAPQLNVADSSVSGPVLCSIRPEAVSVHTDEPAGSQRNVWQTTVELVEPVGDTTRLTVGAPLPLAVDVTTGAVEALGVAEGSRVWVAVKATEISTDAD